MGDLAAYVVRIYPARFLEPFRNQMRQAQQMGLGDSWFVLLEAGQTNAVVARGEPQEMVTQFRQEVLNVFAKAASLAVYVQTSPLVPFYLQLVG